MREYLEALRTNKPKRGRKRTPESIMKRLNAIEVGLGEADAVRELKLLQERITLTDELATMDVSVDLTAVEGSFVEVAADFSVRNGISYQAWREVGVEPSVLRRAGISRSA